MSKNKISDEELRTEIREGIKEAIVDLFLFEPDIMANFLQNENIVEDTIPGTCIKKEYTGFKTFNGPKDYFGCPLFDVEERYIKIK